MADESAAPKVCKRIAKLHAMLGSTNAKER
jgi:hypothetical protein